MLIASVAAACAAGASDVDAAVYVCDATCKIMLCVSMLLFTLVCVLWSPLSSAAAAGCAADADVDVVVYVLPLMLLSTV